MSCSTLLTICCFVLLIVLGGIVWVMWSEIRHANEPIDADAYEIMQQARALLLWAKHHAANTKLHDINLVIERIDEWSLRQ